MKNNLCAQFFSKKSFTEELWSVEIVIYSFLEKNKTIAVNLIKLNASLICRN